MHIEYKPEHAVYIIQNGAVGISGCSDEQVKLYADMKLNGRAYTLLSNNLPVACGGYELMWEGVGQAWFLCLETIQPILLRESKKLFLEITKDLRRVQAPLRSDFTTGERFAKYMGFHKESVMKRYMPDGTDAIMYVL